MPQSRNAAGPDAGTSSLDAAAFSRMLAGGAAALEQQAAALNAINVFPVPDGDTGTNMSSTMRAALDAIADANGASVLAVAKAATHGALMGAKGNSGVILSQIIGGFAAALADHPALDASTFAAAFEHGQQAAYHVVSSPREGTILTGITAVALAGAHAAEHGDAEQVLAAAVEAARGAAERTPDLMPLLKEAGVVDAGAQGLYVMLDGMLRGLRGEEMAEAHDLGTISAGWLTARSQLHDDGLQAGYCTEFVVEGEALDPDAIRAHLASMGESLLVIGDGDLVRVHVHTREPEAAFDYARTLGAVSREKAEDMEAQFATLAGNRDGAPNAAASGIAIIAVAAGAGIEALFRSLGVAQIVRGGQTMNPSAGDIRAAIEASGAREAIVLPNNKNIIGVAEQLDGLSQKSVLVVPTRSVPEGLAAMLAFVPGSPATESVDAMLAAAAACGWGEVTRAVRDATTPAGEIREGDWLGVVNGEVVVVAPSAGEAAIGVLQALVHDEAEVVTVITGADADEAVTGEITRHLAGQDGVAVEVVSGGQPLYPYLFGVE